MSKKLFLNRRKDFWELLKWNSEFELEKGFEGTIRDKILKKFF